MTVQQLRYCAYLVENLRTISVRLRSESRRYANALDNNSRHLNKHSDLLSYSEQLTMNSRQLIERSMRSMELIKTHEQDAKHNTRNVDHD